MSDNPYNFNISNNNIQESIPEENSISHINFVTNNGFKGEKNGKKEVIVK